MQHPDGLTAGPAASAKRRNGAALGSSNGKETTMTKQHFIALAAEIVRIKDVDARWQAASSVARVARQFNPRFVASKFYEACNLEI